MDHDRLSGEVNILFSTFIIFFKVSKTFKLQQDYLMGEKFREKILQGRFLNSYRD